MVSLYLRRSFCGPSLPARARLGVRVGDSLATQRFSRDKSYCSQMSVSPGGMSGSKASMLSWRNHAFTVIDAPGSAGLTEALGIKPARTILGIYFDNSGTLHAFVRSRDGTFITFDPPCSYTYPTSI